MTAIRELLLTSVVTALVGVGTLAASSSSASAATVCNRYGDCWYENDRYDYPPSIGVRYYDNDDWYWRHRHYGWRHHYWRHHDYDRGYWRSGVWIRF